MSVTQELRNSWAARPGSLELAGLARRYGETVALDGLSFSVPAGVIFGLLGPNGAGKTTSMRIILGIERADRGTVRWRGRPIGAAERLQFGYMPEQRGLYPKMRVLDQLAYLGRLRGLGRGQRAPARWAGCTAWAWPGGLTIRWSGSRTAISNAPS